MAGTPNQAVADRLRETGDLLEQQQANPYRVRAYRQAAGTVGRLAQDLGDLFRRQGVAGLMKLPGIGPRIATAIAELLRTGRSSQLERLRGELDAEKMFRSIPGVGPGLARRIHGGLHVDTLEALEMAAHDGRLVALPGIGERRAAAIRSAVGGMLGRPRSGRPREAAEPPVTVLLDVDREYREKAAAGRLPRIAPKRFNPSGEAWLPVLHTERGPWHLTVLFSNTARAHEAGQTRDWVVIYFHTGAEPEGQRTVVTEMRGALVGQRVVRGREAECRAQHTRSAADVVPA